MAGRHFWILSSLQICMLSWMSWGGGFCCNFTPQLIIMCWAILGRKHLLAPIWSYSAVTCFNITLCQKSNVLFFNFSLTFSSNTHHPTEYSLVLVSYPGVYAFGLFTTTIFANAGQVVTGNQTPHFLSACRPNYTALGCQSIMQYIAERRACTGNPLIVMSARKSFPSKDAALSVYSAVYTVVGWSMILIKIGACHQFKL